MSFRSRVSPRSPDRRRRPNVIGTPIEALDPRLLLALRVAIDYSLDSAGFFADTSRRALLQATVNELASQLNDHLAPSPLTTFYAFPVGEAGQVVPVTTQAPADTLVLYAYGAPLAGFSAARGGSLHFGNGTSQRGRGPDTFSPAVSFVMFNTQNINWSFSATTAPDVQHADFVSVVRHEMLQILGLNATDVPFSKLSHGGDFVGAHAQEVNGGEPVPLASDGTHLGPQVHEVFSPVIYLGERLSYTPLDLDMLADIGWEPSQAPRLPEANVESIANVAAARGSAISGLVLQFDRAIDPLRASDPALYSAFAVGRDRRANTRDDRRLKIKSVSYNPVRHTTTVLLRQPAARASRPFVRVNPWLLN